MVGSLRDASILARTAHTLPHCRPHTVVNKKKETSVTYPHPKGGLPSVVVDSVVAMVEPFLRGVPPFALPCNHARTHTRES